MDISIERVHGMDICTTIEVSRKHVDCIDTLLVTSKLLLLIDISMELHWLII
jgi:hypothetical protein